MNQSDAYFGASLIFLGALEILLAGPIAALFLGMWLSLNRPFMTEWDDPDTLRPRPRRFVDWSRRWWPWLVRLQGATVVAFGVWVVLVRART